MAAEFSSWLEDWVEEGWEEELFGAGDGGDAFSSAASSSASSSSSSLGIHSKRAFLRQVRLNLARPAGAVRLRQDGLLIGGVVWDCGVLMAKYVSQAVLQEDHPIARGAVLDLGCGTGVAGLAAAMSRRARRSDRNDASGPVLLSDLASMEELVRQNLAENGFAEESGDDDDRVQFVPIDWSSDGCRDVDASVHNAVEVDVNVLLCSDTLYDRSCHDALAHLLLSSTEGVEGGNGDRPSNCLRIANASIYFTYKLRHPKAERAFLRRLHAARYDISVLSRSATRRLLHVMEEPAPDGATWVEADVDETVVAEEREAKSGEERETGEDVWPLQQSIQDVDTLFLIRAVPR